MDRAEKVLKDLEESAKKRFTPSIGPVKGEILKGIVREQRPKKVLEIGTLYGYSAILMARTMPEGGEILTIEIDEDNAQCARENIKDANLSSEVRVLTGDALDILPQINDRFDLLFIDAKKELYLEYLKLAEKNLGRGSIVVADNVEVFKEDMLDYLSYVRESGNYKSSTVKAPLATESRVLDAMEISIKMKD